MDLKSRDLPANFGFEVQSSKVMDLKSITKKTKNFWIYRPKAVPPIYGFLVHK